MRISIKFNLGNYQSLEVGDDFDASCDLNTVGQMLRERCTSVALGAGLIDKPVAKQEASVTSPTSAKETKPVEEQPQSAATAQEAASERESEADICKRMTMEEIRAKYAATSVYEEKVMWQRIYNLKKEEGKV